MGALLLVWPDKISVNLKAAKWRALEHTYAASGSVSVSQSNLAGEASDTATFSKKSPPAALAAAFPPGITAWKSPAYPRGGPENGLGTSYTRWRKISLIVPGVLEEPLSANRLAYRRAHLPGYGFPRRAPENRLQGAVPARTTKSTPASWDPANFHVYAGIASDSYAATVGTAGDFTGAAAVNDTVVFFQEGGVTKVLGTKPANYQITFTPTSGAMRGSEKSLCLVDGTLFYLSPSGVCAYDGALAEKVSYKLDGWRLKNGVAGAADGRYLLSCQDEDGGAHLLVYDVASGLWHREDGLRAHSFANAGNVLYIFTADALYQANSGTEIFEWECDGPACPSSARAINISRLVAQVEPARGAPHRNRRALRGQRALAHGHGFPRGARGGGQPAANARGLHARAPARTRRLHAGIPRAGRAKRNGVAPMAKIVKNVIWRPHPRQAAFLKRREYEALYGGAAGGGKSDAALMLPLYCAHRPLQSADFAQDLSRAERAHRPQPRLLRPGLSRRQVQRAGTPLDIPFRRDHRLRQHAHQRRPGKIPRPAVRRDRSTS